MILSVIQPNTISSCLDEMTFQLPIGAELFARNGKRFVRWSDTNPNPSNEKSSLLMSSSERFTSEAGGTRTRNLRIDSPAEGSSNRLKRTRVTKRRSRRDTNGDTNSQEIEHGDAVAKSLPSKADSFSAALGMIASLPLSDAEKADAVRRLMAERDGSQR